jgi:2-dehydropantoate 2-reductase
MKLAVLGAGAVGSMFGGLLKRHAPELDVVLIGRGPHMEQMNRQGGVLLQGAGAAGLVRLKVSDRSEDLRDSDVVLLTVKSYSTETALRAARDHIGSALLISIQNGINGPCICQYVPPRQVVLGMTATSIAVPSPGTALMRRKDVTIVGPADPLDSDEGVQQAARLLRKTGLKVAANPNVIGAQYNKLVFNTLGAASSLSALDFLRDGVLHPGWRNTVALPLQRESLETLRQAGIRLARIPGAADARRFGRLLRLLNQPLLGSATAVVVRFLARSRSLHFSLEHDLRRRRRTEIDAINGEIVRLGTMNHIDAPLNRRVVEMVRELERRGGFFARGDVIRAFAPATNRE